MLPFVFFCITNVYHLETFNEFHQIVQTFQRHCAGITLRNSVFCTCFFCAISATYHFIMQSLPPIQVFQDINNDGRKIGRGENLLMQLSRDSCSESCSATPCPMLHLKLNFLYFLLTIFIFLNYFRMFCKTSTLDISVVFTIRGGGVMVGDWFSSCVGSQIH